MADEAPSGNQAKERERQTAVAPLDTIGMEDISAGKAKIDAWLLKMTNNYVSLSTLINVAGSIPVIGNIMALIDAVWDIVDMITRKMYRDVLQWVSLAINLLGVIPLPPGTNAARMSLRPMLHLLRQEIAKSGGQIISAVFIDIITRHLNDTIAGKLETFVDEAKGYLNQFLQKCAAKAEEIADGVIGALRIALGDKPLFDTSAGADKNTYDPDNSTFFGRLMGNVAQGAKSMANSTLSTASQWTVSDALRGKVNGVIGSLEELKGWAREQIMALGSEATEYSIMWMVTVLQKALLKRKTRTAGSQIHAQKGSEAHAQTGGNEKGAIGAQSHNTTDPGCKNCPAPAGFGGSISIATGCESFTHTDFVLAAPLPIGWARSYRSNLGAFDQGSLGARWITPYSTRVDIAVPVRGRRKGQRSFIYHGADGRSHAYPVLAVGQVHRDPIEEITLSRLSDTLLVLDFGKPMPEGTPSDWRESYELVDTAAGKAGTQGRQHFRLVALHARDGAAVGLRYDHVIEATGEQVLSDVISRQGEAVVAHVGTRPDARTGLIESLWEIKDGQVLRQLAAYSHDAHGDLVAAQDENGAQWHYSYSHHLVTRYTDRTGRGTNLAYDGTDVNAKAVREWSDDGSFAFTMEWDRNIRLTYLTDALGQETWYYYDILGYTYRIIHPDKLEEWFYRDAHKNITCHVHSDASADSYVYDAHGNLCTHIRPDGSRVHFEHDAAHRLTGIRDPEGGVWLRAYDPEGRLSEETDPLGHKTAYAHDEAGRVVQITDAKGGVKTLSYTASGELASYTDCSGKTTRWAYDARSRLVRTTDALGQSTRYRYTELGEPGRAGAAAHANHPGQLAEIVHPDQSSEHLVHDAEGRLLAHTDALGRSTRYGYNRAGLIAQRTDAADRTLRYHWDLLGRLTELHNENGSRYDFRYDPVGRLLEEVGFDRRRTEYRYEPTTGVLAEVAEGGQATQLEFDAMGRLVQRSVDGQQTETFAYDGNGRLFEATNQDARLQWFYDAAGNLVREHQHYLDSRRTAVWEHGYDELNQRVATVRPDGHITQWLTYGSGHVHGLLVDGQDILGIERDDLHREVLREQGNGLHQRQAYDPAGRLLEQQIAYARSATPSAPVNAGTADIRRSYQYDRAGQLKAISDSRRGQLSYRYDPVGRLLEATSRLGRETFAFDPAGNILDPEAAQDATTRYLRHAPGIAGSSTQESPRLPRVLDNLLKEYAGTRYTWDDRGNLVERLHHGEKTSFTWDGYNRLKSASTYGRTTHFCYDALGRRIAKRTDQAHTLFGWDGDTLAFESTQSSEGMQEALGRGDSVHYIHEPGGFVPLVQIRQARAMALSEMTDVKALMAANGGQYDIAQDPLWNGTQQHTPEPFEKSQIAYYQCDHLGTPQELTDHEGRVAWSASYKAWGQARQVISEAGRKAGFRNPIRFQGQYLDEETGLHYNRYRYYDPGAGRFVSKDPIKLQGGLNLQLYAPNPVEWTDPRGLAGRSATKPRIEPGNSKEGWQHIDERHISGTSAQGPGDLFAPGTTQDQVQCLCELLVKRGTRTSNPSSRIQTYEKRTIVNGMRARYRGVFDSQDGNRTITAFPVKSE